MDVANPRCCGLDVHKQSVSACALLPGERGHARRERRTFATTTAALLQLRDWLEELGVSAVAMESTGSYWKPVYNVLEERFELLLVNPRDVKTVPGRKSDVRDAEWLGELLRHGLLRASFIPPRPQRELRELLRYRSSLVRERAAELSRIQKVLEGANIKLASVVSDVGGASGRAMLEALAAGEEDPEVLAGLARGRLRAKHPQLVEALRGTLGPHQRELLALQRAHLTALDRLVEEVEARIDARLLPFAAELQRLQSIPGVGRQVAQTIVAEVGADVSRFPTAAHLASWAGLCPGLKESGGKRLSGRTRHGNAFLEGMLVQAAHVAARSRSFLGVRYRRLVVRLGARKSAVALAHTILTIAYRLLRDGTTYEELGADYYDRRDRERIARRLTRRLEQIGYRVDLQPTA